jgi:hypothetical protein
VIAILDFVVRHGLEFSVFSDFDFSGTPFSELAQLMQKSPRNLLLRAFKESTEVQRLIAILTLDGDIAELLPQIHVKKKRIFSVLRRSEIIETFSDPEIANFAIHCLSAAKFPGALCAVTNIISRLSEIPDTLLQAAFQAINDNVNNLPIDGIAHFALAVLSRVHTGMAFPQIFSDLANNSEVRGHPKARLLESLVHMQDDVPEIHPAVAEYLNSEVPSYFRCGLCLLTRIVTHQPAKLCREPLRGHFSIVYDRFKKFERIAPVIAVLPESLVPVIGDSDFERVHLVIFKHFDRILWTPSSPQILAFGPFFAEIISQTNPTALVHRRVSEYMSNLWVIPALFRVWLSLVVARVERVDDPAERQEMIFDTFRDWFGHLSEIDSYYMSEQYYEWAMALMSISGFEEATTHFCVTVRPMIPRFFPYFAAIARLCSEYEMGDWHEPLERASTVQPQRVQTMAFRVAGETRNYRMALKLALLEEDSPEADELMASIEHTLFT